MCAAICCNRLLEHREVIAVHEAHVDAGFTKAPIRRVPEKTSRWLQSAAQQRHGTIVRLGV